jgi:hypothetical protein
MNRKQQQKTPKAIGTTFRPAARRIAHGSLFFESRKVYIRDERDHCSRKRPEKKCAHTLLSSNESPGAPHPRFPVEFRGFPELHAPLLKERRTRGPVQSCVQEIRGISLVFCEMWDTADLPLKPIAGPVHPGYRALRTQRLANPNKIGERHSFASSTAAVFSFPDSPSGQCGHGRGRHFAFLRNLGEERGLCSSMGWRLFRPANLST